MESVSQQRQKFLEVYRHYQIVRRMDLRFNSGLAPDGPVERDVT